MFTLAGDGSWTGKRAPDNKAENINNNFKAQSMHNLGHTMLFCTYHIQKQ
jgi:hypothetical protein